MKAEWVVLTDFKSEKLEANGDFVVLKDAGERQSAWDSQQAKKLFRIYQRKHDPEVRDKIFNHYLSLVKICAWKYSGRGVDYDDLFQEGCMGLLKAIERFDLSRGVEFHTYAFWFVEGWMRQYFRDKTWVCKVPKKVKDMSLHIRKLSRKLGRFPTREEIVEHCDIPEDCVDEAIAAAATWDSVSFYHDSFDGAINPLVEKDASCMDDRLEDVLTRMAIEEATRKALNPTEISVVRMYYYDNLSQRQIARKLGTYQMMVSRTLQSSTSKLDAALSEKEKMVS